MQFAEVFGDLEIVVPLARQLSWSHFLLLIPLPSQEARLFYASQPAQIEPAVIHELRQRGWGDVPAPNPSSVPLWRHHRIGLDLSLRIWPPIHRGIRGQAVAAFLAVVDAVAAAHIAVGVAGARQKP